MESLARELVQAYVEGWLHNDVQKICSALTDDCVIVESHGPRYQGMAQIKKWFDLWLAAPGQVLQWDIRSFHYCAELGMAFFEWDFVCVVAGVRSEFPGMSMVKFVDSKISSIHEYRMTQAAFDWRGDKLFVS